MINYNIRNLLQYQIFQISLQTHKLYQHELHFLLARTKHASKTQKIPCRRRVDARRIPLPPDRKCNLEIPLNRLN